jgi:3-oxoacyl-[acyl-carrier-protein] synthase-3
MKSYINNIKIRSIASSVPCKIVELSEIAFELDLNQIERVSKTTGIYKIRESDPDTTTSDLCLKAAELIFENEPDLKEKIDGIVFVSQTADFKIPQTSHIIQHRLGLSIDTICFDLPIGCNGYIYGLYQASILISAGSCNKVMVLAGDTTTKIINKKDKSVRPVFGDAGTATIVEHSNVNQGLSFIIRSDGSGFKNLFIPSGGARNPTTIDSFIENTDIEGNIRSEMDLYMDGMAIFNFAIKRVPEIIVDSLVQVGWEKDDVSLFALHQANKFMIDYLSRKTKIDPKKMPLVVDGFGNTGPASIPLLLTEKLSNVELTSLTKVILCGFGVGLSWGTIACDLSKTKIYKTIIY